LSLEFLDISQFFYNIKKLKFNYSGTDTDLSIPYYYDSIFDTNGFYWNDEVYKLNLGVSEGESINEPYYLYYPNENTELFTFYKDFTNSWSENDTILNNVINYSELEELVDPEEIESVPDYTNLFSIQNLGKYDYLESENDFALEDSFSSIFISQFLDESFDSDFDYDDVLIYGDMFKFFDFF
jgi:hypothetical protein